MFNVQSRHERCSRVRGFSRVAVEFSACENVFFGFRRLTEYAGTILGICGHVWMIPGLLGEAADRAARNSVSKSNLYCAIFGFQTTHHRLIPEISSDSDMYMRHTRYVHAGKYTRYFYDNVSKKYIYGCIYRNMNLQFGKSTFEITYKYACK